MLKGHSLSGLELLHCRFVSVEQFIEQFISHRPSLLHLGEVFLAELLSFGHSPEFGDTSPLVSLGWRCN